MEKKDLNIYNLLIIDESGSMESIYNEALSGINETLNSIRKTQEEFPEQHHFVSIVTFEGNGPKGVKLRRDREPVNRVEDLGPNDYRPGGCTPLYDAIGLSVNELNKKAEDGAAVLVTIITDGYENASREYSGKAIKELVSRQREKGWTFAYIGADQDAIEVARELNIRNAMNFSSTPEDTIRMSISYRKAQKRYSKAVSNDSRLMYDMCDLFVDED